MREKALCLGILLFIMCNTWAIGEKNVIGLWKSIDDKEQFTTSIIATYMYQNKLYGRVIVSFDEDNGEFIDSYMNPSKIAHKVDGNPLLLDIDIFFDLSFDKDDEKYSGGRAIDPRNGKTYKAEVWTTKEGLILRGKFGPFGMNNLFFPASENDLPLWVEKPNTSTFTPYLYP